MIGEGREEAARLYVPPLQEDEENSTDPDASEDCSLVLLQTAKHLCRIRKLSGKWDTTHKNV